MDISVVPSSPSLCSLCFRGSSRIRVSGDARSGRWYQYVDAPRSECGGDIPGPEPLCCLLSAQDRVQMAERQATDKQVRLIPGTPSRPLLKLILEVPVV